jgi:hypothetical protein
VPEIALPAFHVNTTTPITVKAGYELAQDLKRYKAFYEQAYGADVSEADLLREMARRFMENDREFQAFKTGVKPRSRNRRRTGTSAVPPSSEAA